MIKKFIIGAAVVAAASVGLSACSINGSDVTDPSVTSLRYDGGVTAGAKFKECVPAGTKLATDDDLYPYPNTQRQDMWDSSNSASDHKDLGTDGELTDSSGVPVTAKVNVAFFLNTSCTPVKVGDKTYPGGTLQAFHELVGKTRKAYFNDDGTYNQGWIDTMNYYISPQVEQFLSDQTRQYTAEQLWLNQDGIRDKIANDLTAALPQMVNDNMETDLDFYKGFKVQITSFRPDGSYLDLYKQRQAANIKAETADANKQAQITEAQAATAVEQEKAKTLQATISGYGSVEDYLRAQAIAAGLNPFQPNGVLSTK